MAGLHDWTIDGVHLCMTRLNLLRLNTMPAMDHAQLGDAAAMAKLDNRQLRDLGRLVYPMLRRKGEKGFSRISWDEALALTGAKLRVTDPQRVAFFLTARGVTNEVYYAGQKAARFPRHQPRRQCGAHLPFAFDRGDEAHVGRQRVHPQLPRLDRHGPDRVFGSNPANDQPVSTKPAPRKEGGDEGRAGESPTSSPG